MASGPAGDPFGFPLDDDSKILSSPPSVLVYGPVGAGKSTEVAKAFGRCIFIKSVPTVLRPYYSWIRDHAAEAKKAGYGPLAARTLAEFYPGKLDAAGAPIPVATRANLDRIYRWFVHACNEGRCPYEGIVMDEWTEFLRRVVAEIEIDPEFEARKEGKRNAFRQIAAIKNYQAKWCALPRLTGKILVLVCHSREPTYEEDKDSPNFSRLKYKGGPSLTPGTLIGPVCAAADVVLHLDVTGGDSGEEPQRRYLTAPSETWERKVRDFSVKAEEPLGLRELLARAGYKV